MFISYSSTDASAAFSAHMSADVLVAFIKEPVATRTDLFPQKTAFEHTVKTAADDQPPLL